MGDSMARGVNLGDDTRFGLMVKGEKPAGLFPRSSEVLSRLREMDATLRGMSNTATLLPTLLVPAELATWAKHGRRDGGFGTETWGDIQNQVRVYPWRTISGQAAREGGHLPEDSFVWLELSPHGGGWDDGVSWEMAEAWADMLGSMGIQCERWTGETLRWLNNGGVLPEMLGRAWEEAGVAGDAMAIGEATAATGQKARRTRV